MATPEPPSQQPAPQTDSASPAEQPPTPEQPTPPLADAPPPGLTTPPPGVPAAQPQYGQPQAFAQPGVTQRVVPGMPATASQPMWPVPPPQAPPTGQQPGMAPPPGPTGSYPAMHPVPQAYGYPAPPQVSRQRGHRIPGKDIAAGVALIVAAGLTVGGSFPNLDHAVDREVSNGQLGAVNYIVDTAAWYYHGDTPGHPEYSFHLLQFFGVGLAVGALLALVTGVLLLLGVGRSVPRLSMWGAVAGAVLVGAILSTEMSVVDDVQADSATGTGTPFTPGAHVTTPELGFWLLLGAGVVALAAVVLVLIRDRRVEPPTPRFGIPVQSMPVAAPQAPGYPPQQYPGPQHG